MWQVRQGGYSDNLLRRLCAQPPREVMCTTSLGGYVNFESLKITAPTVFHQRFESGTLGPESTVLLS